ncbi:MAG: type II secretion system minor pseudopilin GspJ, partial [Salinisphaeraceae bacterium]|nr:type II secretion system minor pseudopilin GspJ [Salinisphaeraceae bacterium]
MRNQGFTLLELLIALAIFSLMSVMAYGGLSAVLQTRETVGEAMDKLTEVQKAIYRLQTDIEGSQSRPIRNQYGDVDPAMRLEIDGLGLYFTRSGWRNPLSVPRSVLQRVYYRLEEKQLIRRSWPILDGIAVESPTEDSYQEVVLLNDIEDIEWRFLQTPPVSGAEFDELEWIEQWPPFSLEPDDNALPLAVEVQITSAHWGELRYLFRLNPGMRLQALT